MMKKIILSTTTMALLATASQAATADANLTAPHAGGVTYNTEYTATLSGVADVNNTMEVNYVSGADLLNKNIVYVKLDAGASFLGTASDWTLDGNASTGTAGTGISLSGDTLSIRMGQDIAAGTALTLVNAADGNATSAAFGLDTAAKTDIKAHFTARDNENGIDLDDAATDLVLFKAETYKIAGKIVCDEVIIDSDDKTQFLASSAQTDHKAKCNYDIAGASLVYDIDYDYSDLNITTTIGSGNFLDGNFTAGGNAPIANPAPVNGIQTFETPSFDLDKNASGADYNATFTYNLSATNEHILTSETFPINSTIEFNQNNDAQKVDLTDEKMTWELSTYLVEVLGMKNNPANNVSTNIKLYNKDTVVAVVDATVSPADGSDTYTLTNITTVPAGGSIGVSAADISAAAIAAGKVAPTNGYKVVLTYQDVDKKNGNAVATQRNADGTYGIRINDNGDNSKNTTGHQGL